MGTLFEQPERDEEHNTGFTADEMIIEIKRVMGVHGLSMDQSLRFFELLENKRRNQLYVNNGNILDEQLAGFGKLIDRFLDAYEDHTRKQ
jgi:hypothetical protein